MKFCLSETSKENISEEKDNVDENNEVEEESDLDEKAEEETFLNKNDEI